ncbi:Pyridine nucleotide-disulphide oxidoreductase [Streptosporangium subroseum]|uniref:Pyridine nucleotide-disulphide oxidoreductase n=1 Tax=Streptosporangium subroseum TaxID=106412 RepID=A0A239NKZ7_9ACTN|nr:FAD-dependent oxidoreductase [Streptosporangium subroseum]SNT55440.1 Pyridine nucleotide-disulphide oxidoreductase [Streptosporangium subroseum]
MRSIAVVGASLAGLSAARALRGQGFEGRLTLIGTESHRPYDRPPLSKEFLAGRMSEADLALEADDEDLGAEWRLGATATGLDPSDRRVLLDDGTSVRADGIVVATGASARTLPGGGGLGGVHTLRSLDDARALRSDLVKGRRLVVIGAGFIGAEVASTARDLGLDVTVVETAPTPFAGALGAEMGAVVASLHGDHGVRLICGVGVRGLLGAGRGLAGTDRADGVQRSEGAGRVDGASGPEGVDRVEGARAPEGVDRVEGARAPEGADRVEGALLDDDRILPADVVLVGIGARPNVEWLAGAGFQLTNGVVCDAGGATGVPGVVAVGDCAAWFDPAMGYHHRVEHWTGALRRPAAAAVTLLSGGATAPDPPSSPYFWSDQYGMKIQFVGHARPGDTVTVEEGDVADRSFLAVYRRQDRPVAVLSLNQVRLFTRWRRRLDAVPNRTDSTLRSEL